MRQALRSSPVHVRAIIAAALALALVLAIAALAWAAPSLSIDPGQSGPTNDPTPHFTFTVDETATSVECSIVADQATPDYGPCSAETSHQPDRALADGDYVFWVRAGDGVEETERSLAFSVDTRAPTLSIDPGQAGPANDSTPQLAFTVDGSAATVECSVDLGTPVSCASPFTVGAPLSEGRHTFLVRASDALGNESSDSLDFTVDTRAPTLSIDPGQAGPANDPTPRFTFAVAGATAVECSVDLGTPVSCASPFTVGAPLSDGRHTLFVHASDAAGNESSASQDFTIDTDRPAVSVTSGPTLTRVARPSFGFSAEAGARTECSVDRGTPAYAPCSSPYMQVAALSDGRYTFRVRATDEAGNQDQDLHPFTVDSAAPSLTIDSGPEGPTNATMPSFAFTAESGASAECAIASDPGVPAYGPCSGAATHAPPAPLAEGSYTFWVRATDAADNQAIFTRSFTIDTTAPSVVITLGPSGTTSDSTPLFQFAAEAESTVACSIDQGTPAFGPCTGAGAHAVVAPLADGAYTFRVRATDRAGNEWTATRDFTVDTVPDAPSPGSPRPDPTDPASPARPLLLSPFPVVRIAGSLTSTGVRIRLLSVRAPRGALVRVMVRPACGRSRRSRRCRVVQTARTVGRSDVIGFRGFARAYRSGTVIVVLVWRADRIGKYTRFTIVRGRAPRRVDQCLVPEATRGSRCPSV